MSGETRKKVDKKELIRDLIEEVALVDADKSLQQFQRTKKYARAAQKLKSRMYEDGRRGERTKLSLMSYRRYLSDVRKALRAEGWKHHSLPKETERLAKKYPEYKTTLRKLVSQDNETMRRTHTELCKEVEAKKKATKEKKYRDAYNEFRKMKLDHDVLRHLAMQPAEKDELADMDSQALETKKTSTININYNWVMARINELTNSSMYGYQALGLALACGRRPVEILYQGRFEPKGKNTVVFSGQAKERGGADYDTKYTIYTLIPAADFCKKMDAFRKLEPVAALKKYDDYPETARNTEINRRTAKNLNTITKAVFENDHAMYKWSRAIWSRIVFTQHFEKDKQWKNKDEDIFWREMLGHDQEDTQQHYKFIKLSFDDIEDDYATTPVFTNKDGENIRIKRLMRLGKDYRIANRKALVRINEIVMQSINDNEAIKLTRSNVAKATGSNRVAINDYFTLVEESYGKMLEEPLRATAKPAKEEAEPEQAETPAPKKKTASRKTKPRAKATEK